MGGRVLRHSEVLTVRETLVAPDAERTIGVSAGSADVLGLRHLHQTDAPTTAYLMVGTMTVLSAPRPAAVQQDHTFSLGLSGRLIRAFGYCTPWRAALSSTESHVAVFR